MKINDKLKKTINMGLIGLLSLQTVGSAQAAGGIGSISPSDNGFFDDILDSSILNVTPSGMINKKDSNGNIQSIGFHTTSVYFRFGPSFDMPEPIFNFSAPKMSIGCGGLSIKGMFASLIGIDRFEAMLKNAGASFAWGIVVGLVYSLPGIGTAFRMLNEWAKKIQQLFGNACQSGMNLGAMIGKNSGIGEQAQSAIDKVKNSEFMGAAKGTMDTLEQPFKELSKSLNLTFDENMVLQVPSDNTVTLSQSSENWKYIFASSIVGNSMQLNYMNAVISSMPADTMKAFLTKVYGTGNFADIKPFQTAFYSLTYDNSPAGALIGGNPEMKIIPIKLSELSNSMGAASLAQRSELSKGLFSLAFSRKISGDLGISGKGSLTDYAKDIQKAIGGTVTDEEKKEASKKLMDKVQGGGATFNIATLDPTGLNVNNKPEFISNIINYIAKGNTVGDNSTTVKFGVKAPSYMVTALPADIKDDTTGTKKIFIFNSLLQADSLEFFSPNSTSKGSIARSKSLLKRLLPAVDATGGIAANPQGLDIDSFQDEEGVVLLVPGIIDKIRIIQSASMEGRYSREDLIDTLAMHNAYRVTYTAVRGMLSGGLFAENELPVYQFNGDKFIREVKSAGRNKAVTEAYNQHQATISAANAKLLEGLDDKIIEIAFGGDKTLKNSRDLDRLFAEAELKSKSEAVKANQPAVK